MTPYCKLLVIVLTGIPLGVFAQAAASPWKQDELTERFMRSLSKQQCMAKTVASMKAGCSSEECLKTLSGISGDCVVWGSGDLTEFCATYDREYLSRYCASNDLDARHCIVLHVGKAVHCKPSTTPK